jgi:hypothetical protein
MSVGIQRINGGFDKVNHTVSSCLTRNPGTKTAWNTKNLRMRNALFRSRHLSRSLKLAFMLHKPARFRILLIALDMRHNLTQTVYIIINGLI